MNLRCCLLVLLLGLSTMQVAVAQDDEQWWRKLFGQRRENVEGQSEVDVPTVKPSEDVEMEQPSDSVNSPDTGIWDPVEIIPPMGSVEVFIPEKMAAHSEERDEPEDIRLSGFRVQIFMGRLDSARALRGHLKGIEGLELDVYLTPYPPMFGVQVGNFMTSLGAHREKVRLSELFPDALVVPAKLTLEQAFPSSSDCIRTPRMHIEHSD